MPTVEPRHTLLPVTFSAGNVLLLLAALACFLAAFVVPPSLPEFGSVTGYVFLTLGCVFLFIAAISMLLRPWISAISQKLGIRSRMLLPREGMVYLGVMLIIAIAALTGFPEGLWLPRLGDSHRIHDKVETKSVVMAAVDSVARRGIKHHVKLTLRLLQRINELN